MEDYCLRDEQPYYSVVIPVYNSQYSLKELCEGINDVLKPYNYEIIAVDDSSSDDSLKTLLSLQDKYSLIVLHNHENLGQAMTTWRGINAARGIYIITIDDDLEFAPVDINLLINKQNLTRAELVYGIPLANSKNGLRRLGSLLVQYLSPLLKGSSFRIFRRDSLISLKVKSRKALLDIDLQKCCQKIEVVMVKHNKRKFGRSNYSFFKLTKIFIFSGIHLLFSKKN